MSNKPYKGFEPNWLRVKSVSVSALSAPPREGFHLGPLWGRSPTICA